LGELKREVRAFLKGADLLLLFLGVCAVVFGSVVISSAARAGQTRAVASFLKTQLIGAAIGVVLFIAISAVSLDLLAKFWKWILGFNLLLLLLLATPFRAEEGGNMSWVYLPGIPFGIQPAEIVKVTFTLLLAAQVFRFREKPSGILPVGGYVAHLLLMLGLIYVLSKDVGVALIYIPAFSFVLLAAGVKLRWFALGGIAVTAASPLLWRMLSPRLQARILIVFNPMLDPEDVGWQGLTSMRMIGGGGLTGQGLYNGEITQTGQMFGQHNDFIFAALGEELGFIGCLGCILLLTVIILRCLWIARRAKNGMGSMVCCGVAGILIFQTFLNIAMCLGVAPVIGITLPFFSYGGSSIMASFAALGLVSSVKRHPERTWRDV
jgi:rod shape determining protein RodA